MFSEEPLTTTVETNARSQVPKNSKKSEIHLAVYLPG